MCVSSIHTISKQPHLSIEVLVLLISVHVLYLYLVNFPIHHRHLCVHALMSAKQSPSSKLVTCDQACDSYMASDSDI